MSSDCVFFFFFPVFMLLPLKALLVQNSSRSSVSPEEHVQVRLWLLQLISTVLITLQPFELFFFFFVLT